MNKVRHIISVVLILIMLLTACGQNAPTWQEQYDLGVRYLSEGNYEEAIIAFTAAIEIDPRQAGAYIGRGDAYIQKANDTEDTSTVAELYELARADYEKAAELGAEAMDERIEDAEENIQTLRAAQDAETLLQTLYERLNDGDTEGAKSLMRQEDYIAMSASVTDNCFFYGEENGKGIAVYPDNYYYFGDWQDGLRAGNGMWIRAVYEEDSDMESYIYKGQWANDKPNGEGRISRRWYEEKIQVEEGEITSVSIETEGTFSDGLRHGTIHEVWHMNDGETLVWSPITAVNGMYQPIEERDGRAVVAYAPTGTGGETTLLGSGRVHTISGFDAP